jgi:hypothetical protein
VKASPGPKVWESIVCDSGLRVADGVVGAPGLPAVPVSAGSASHWWACRWKMWVSLDPASAKRILVGSPL